MSLELLLRLADGCVECAVGEEDVFCVVNNEDPLGEGVEHGLDVFGDYGL